MRRLIYPAVLLVGLLLAGGANATSPTSTGCGAINCFAFTGLTTDKFVLRCHGLIAGNATQNMVLQFGTSTGPSWQAGASAYNFSELDSNTNGASPTAVVLTAAGIPGPFEPPTSGAIGADYVATIQGLTSTSLDKSAGFKAGWFDGTKTHNTDGFGFDNTDTAAVTAIRLIDIQGTPVSIASGSCTLEALGS